MYAGTNQWMVPAADNVECAPADAASSSSTEQQCTFTTSPSQRKAFASGGPKGSAVAPFLLSRPVASHQRPYSAGVATSAVRQYNSRMIGVSPLHRQLREDLDNLDTAMKRLTEPFAPYFSKLLRDMEREEDVVRCAERVSMEDQWETIFRMFQEETEHAARLDIIRQRRQEALVPWCTASCQYCCMGRLQWTRHVKKSWSMMLSHLRDQEATCRMSLQEALLAELRSVEDFCNSHSKSQQLTDAHRDTVEAECLHVQAIVRLHEKMAFDSMEKDKAKLLEHWYDSGKRAEMARRELNMETSAFTMEARERRLMQQSTFQCVDIEDSLRAGVEAMEMEQRCHVATLREMGTGAIERLLWDRRNAAMVAELDALRQYKAEAIAAKEKEEADRVQRMKQGWVDEFNELKRMKKQGPPKGNQPLPPCPKCNEIPAKDEYTHRLSECPERAVNCVKCSEVMPMSMMEGHKTSCPQRVVQCAGCGHFYKACYLDTVHTASYCSDVKHARESVLPSLVADDFVLMLVEAESLLGEQEAILTDYRTIQRGIDVGRAEVVLYDGSAGSSGLATNDSVLLSILTTSVNSELTAAQLQRLSRVTLASINGVALPQTMTSSSPLEMLFGSSQGGVTERVGRETSIGLRCALSGTAEDQDAVTVHVKCVVGYRHDTSLSVRRVCDQLSALRRDGENYCKPQIERAKKKK